MRGLVLEMLNSKAKARRRLSAFSAEKFTILVNKALLAENLSFSTYALMMEVYSHEEPPTLAAVALATGYSYWGVRNQVDRTPWFTKIQKQLTRLTLTPEAHEKLARISRRIARYTFA